MKRLMLSLVVFVLLLAACGGADQIPAAPTDSLPAAPPATVGSGTFFDDFTYSGRDDAGLAANGWIVRSEAGGPGMADATWPAEDVSFVDDPALPGNRLAQLSSSTDGTPAGTRQAELFQQRKFYEGTYASRVFFTDQPGSGPDGDAVVQTFFTITPLNYDMDPDYGEIDFEYLPNGGWGVKPSTLFLTTWETFREDPWEAVSASDSQEASFAGWHTLVAVVSGVQVKYYVDGILLATHGDTYYPETPMSINYNLWFIDGGLATETGERTYIEQIDWLYYAGEEALSPEQVDGRVKEFRAGQVAHVDTVPAWTAPDVVVPNTPTPGPAGPRPFEFEMHKLAGIQLDGSLQDWPAEPDFVLNKQSDIVYTREDGVWTDPNDFSAQAWAGWTDDGLYFAVKVTDDQVVQDWQGTDLWQGDYLEIQLDTQFEQDYDSRELSDDDYQLGISPGNFAGQAAEVFVWEGPVTGEQLNLIQHAETRTADGYILEVFIPASLLPGLAFTEGSTLGFNINPSDTDSADNPQDMMMSTSPIRLRTDPTTFGKAVLAP
jgi:hypothetical protein